MSSLNCGANPCDPAFNLFTSTTIPGADAGQLGNARAHFAQLTGRITTISNQVALDPATNLYVPNSPRRREGAIGVWSAYAQDSWRMSPTVTLTGGLRWDVQTPFSASNDTMSAVEFEVVLRHLRRRTPTPPRTTSARSSAGRIRAWCPSTFS